MPCKGPSSPALLVLLVGSLLVACGGASQHERLLKNAQKAEANKQWAEAAGLYAQACQLKPSDQAVCERARQLSDYTVELAAYEARKQCQSGALEQCLATLRPVRKVQSANSDKVQAVLEEAAPMAVARCDAYQPTGEAAAPLVSGVHMVQCLEGWRDELWQAAAFRGAYGERATRVRDLFVQESQGHDPSAPGAPLSYLLAAACVAPLPADAAAHTQDLAERFRRRAATPLTLSYSVAGHQRSAPGTCQQIAKDIGRGLHCDGSSADGAATIELAAEVYSIEPRWQKNHRDEQKVAHYLAGQQTINNPDYERARLNFEIAERNFSEIEAPTLEAEARCNETGSEADCSDYNSRVDLYNRRKNERDSARSDFNNEPATLTQDVYRDQPYVTRTHEWRSPFRASIRLGNNTARPEVNEIVYTDTEQTGFAEAGIAQDPFEEPPDTYFRDESSRWLIARLTAYVTNELERRAETLAHDCKVDPIDCWARGSVWSGASDLGLRLLREYAAIHRDQQVPAPSCTASLFGK